MHKVIEVPIESAGSLRQRTGQAFTPGQQRILELENGDSFLLQTFSIDEGNDIIPRWRYRSASSIATRLSRWARGHHVQIAYRVIDKRTVRIWRLGTI